MLLLDYDRSSKKWNFLLTIFYSTSIDYSNTYHYLKQKVVFAVAAESDPGLNL